MNGKKIRSFLFLLFAVFISSFASDPFNPNQLFSISTSIRTPSGTLDTRFQNQSHWDQSLNPRTSSASNLRKFLGEERTAAEHFRRVNRYVSLADHLDGKGKAELWEQFLNQIIQIHGPRFSAIPFKGDDGSWVFRAENGNAIVITSDGAVYRGTIRQSLKSNEIWHVNLDGFTFLGGGRGPENLSSISEVDINSTTPVEWIRTLNPSSNVETLQRFLGIKTPIIQKKARALEYLERASHLSAKNKASLWIRFLDVIKDSEGDSLFYKRATTSDGTVIVEDTQGLLTAFLIDGSVLTGQNTGFVSNLESIDLSKLKERANISNRIHRPNPGSSQAELRSFFKGIRLDRVRALMGMDYLSSPETEWLTYIEKAEVWRKMGDVISADQPGWHQEQYVSDSGSIVFQGTGGNTLVFQKNGTVLYQRNVWIFRSNEDVKESDFNSFINLTAR